METTKDSMRGATLWDRPKCMVTLGLSPPYALADVKQAYFAKAKRSHPDTGGSVASFLKVQRAFQEATDYVFARPSSWAWIADRVEWYRRTQALIEELKTYGAIVQVEQDKWLASSWGEDFVQLTEHAAGIRLCGARITDAVLDRLVREPVLLGNLRFLDLARSTISDRGLQRLCVLTGLEHLDLRDTPITGWGLRKVVARLPDLRVLDLRGTSVSWWARFKLRWFFPELTLLASSTPHTERPAALVTTESLASER